MQDLPRIHNPAGNLTVVHSDVDVPFPVRRVYYVYDVPGGVERGGHAHRELHQFCVAVSGSFDVILDDGLVRQTYSLNRPYRGIHIVPGVWGELGNFSSGSVLLVLASDHYQESDYLRDYDEFLEWKRPVTTGPYASGVQPLVGKSIVLRTATPEDAAFILKLRVDPVLSRYLSPVDNDLEKQTAWLNDYLQRECAGQEFYFIISTPKSEPLGTIRLYNLDDDSFTWGSWILRTGRPRSAAMESILAVHDFGFYTLGYHYSKFESFKDNARALRFYQRFGARVIHEDQQKYYFRLALNEYEEIRARHRDFLPEV